MMSSQAADESNAAGSPTKLATDSLPKLFARNPMWSFAQIICAAADTSVLYWSVYFFSSDEILPNFFAFLLVAVFVGLAIYLTLGVYQHVSKKMIAELSVAFPNAEIWLSSMFTRNRKAFAALQADVQFDVQLDNYWVQSFLVMDDRSLGVWTRKRGFLRRLAVIPVESASVEGRVWDTPYLLLGITSNTAGQQEISINPSHASFGRRWQNKESAYRAISSWAKAKRATQN